MAQPLTNAAIGILERFDYDGFAVRFPQIDPTLYNEVNEVLTRLGGKWKGGRTKAHIFQEDPAILIEYVLETGTMPPKNPGAFFPTPAEVARGIMIMSDLDRLCDEDLILEPEAGTAALLDYLEAHAAELLILLRLLGLPKQNPRITLLENQ